MSEKPNIEKNLVVTMPDGTKWAVPVKVIAWHRAQYYADQYTSFKKSFKEDTAPLFNEAAFEIHDWAADNMNWEDVKESATKFEADVEPVDYQEGWVNGEWSVV